MHSVGQEFVAFLQDEPQGGRAELLGPHFMFAVKEGVVHGLRQPSQDSEQEFRDRVLRKLRKK